MILNQTFTLSNGVQIPKLGLGTWLIPDKDMALLAGIGQDYGDDSWWPVFSKKKQV